MGFRYGFWRAVCLCIQIFLIPSTLYFLEVSCGCQTKVGETVGHFHEVSPGIGMAGRATRWDLKGTKDFVHLGVLLLIQVGRICRRKPMICREKDHLR